ncbi:MAG: C10 family peptidase [bacterium]|nr:C10 family peptidase [bacterium]
MKRLIQFLVLCALPLSVAADEVTVQQAAHAVGTWLSAAPTLGCPLGRTVLAARTCQSPGGGRFHVVRLAGGGFVVTSSDTMQEPVVAFSPDGDLLENERNPLWTLLCRDFEDRQQQIASRPSTARLMHASAPSASERKWAQLLTGDASSQGASLASARPSVSDLRVAPFIKSSWGQTSVGGMNCYNLLTPKNYPVGCVATAGAQIMRYFEWPKTTVSAFSNAFCALDDVPVTLSAAGGVYDWTNMPLQPSVRTPEAQRLAISGLMRDLGVACGMNYGSGGSAAGSYMLTRAWTTHFGYASAMAYTLVDDLPNEIVRRALISNFDARLPVEIGISGPDGGHAIVGDGYGYSDGTLYYHFNMGWDGNSNAWYAPPDLSAGGYTFNAIGSLVYNIFPERSAGHTICSGRVLNAAGVPIPGAAVSATDYTGERCAESITDEHGIYALILPSTWVYPLPYVLHAEYDGEGADLSVKVKMCISTLVNADGTFNSNTAPAPAVNNLIDQNLTITAISGVAAPTFSPAPGLFHPTVSVTISCPTQGAAIHYTTDGSEPTEESPLYTSPFVLSQTATVKARAFKTGLFASPIVEVEYIYDTTRDAPAGDYFAHPIAIAGTSGSHQLANTSTYSKEDGEPIHSLLNGSYYPETRSAWYIWTAPGSGEMTFTVQSHRKIGSTTYYLHAMIAAYQGGDIRFAERLALGTSFADDGSTSIKAIVQQGEIYRIVVFAYADDPMPGPYNLSWHGVLETFHETQNTEVPVPFDWLSAHYPGTVNFEDQASAIGANGRPVWESYLLALDPTNPLSDLRITHFVPRDGAPIFGWNVTNENLRSLGYEYRIKGKTSLEEPWGTTNATHRFFRLFVEKQR